MDSCKKLKICPSYSLPYTSAPPLRSLGRGGKQLNTPPPRHFTFMAGALDMNYKSHVTNRFRGKHKQEKIFSVEKNSMTSPPRRICQSGGDAFKRPVDHVIFIFLKMTML